MAGKKGDSARSGSSGKSKGGDKKAYNWITLEEIRARETKYSIRLAEIRIARNLSNLAKEQYHLLQNQHIELNKWEEYVNCLNLPQPDDPPNLRTFFDKINFYEKFDCEASVNWLLAVDERSVLTQDIFKKDRSKKGLYNELVPDLGGVYNKNVLLGLKVLKRMNDFLDEPEFTNALPPHILDDLFLVKSLAQAEVASLFYRLMYRVICCEDAYMKSLGRLTSEFVYESPDDIFTIHIWSLNHIPLRFEFLEEETWEIDFHSIKVKLRLPITLLHDDITLAANHVNFDHVSEYAVSFNPTLLVPMENLSAAIPDLYECLVNEWHTQLKMMEDVRNSVLIKNLDYEEKAKEAAAEAERLAREKKSGKGGDNAEKKPRGKGKGGADSKQGMKEPIHFEPGKYPDVWSEFLERENHEFQNYMNIVYHPDTLKLKRDEINLKQYFILGGLYQFYSLVKPRHYCIRTFNITWHNNNGVLEVRKDFTSPYMGEEEEEDLVEGRSDAYEDTSRKKDEPPVNYDLKYRDQFKLTFVLPEYLVIWEEPVACMYCDDAIGYFEKDDPELVQLTPAQIKAQEKAAEAEAAAEKRLSNLRGANAALFQESVIPSNLIYRLSIAMEHKKEIDPASLKPVVDLVPLDFELEKTLDKAETRNIERYCVPNILSSYCFKKEREEQAAAASKENRGGTLLRKHDSDSSDLHSEEPIFKFLVMERPERMFPVAQDPEAIDMAYTADIEHLQKPTSFYDLVQTLNNIKNRYRMKPDLLLNLKHFIPAVKWMYVRKSLDTESIGSRRSTGSNTSILSFDKPSLQSIRESEVSLERLDLEDAALEDAKEDSLSSVQGDDSKSSYTYAHWTTKYIKHSSMDKKKFTFTIYTERLGCIGLAYNRYIQFPFRHWSLEPTGENEITFTVVSSYVKVVLIITPDGCKGYVTDSGEKYTANPKKYLDIPEPINDYKELKKMFREKNCSIFAELDAPFYITKGYFSQKHFATEMHTYNCMAMHCASCKFVRSSWNRLSKRREILLSFSGTKEVDDAVVTVLCRPEQTEFVEVKELCSDDLNVFKLEFTKTWRNITPYYDLHNAIVSIFPAALDQRIRDPMLLTAVKNVLSEVRPLSYS